MERAATLLICLAAGGVLSPSPAHAQRKSGILVLKLEAEGLPDELATALDDAVRTGVRRSKKGKLLPAPALDFSGMQMAAGCLDDGADCLLAMGRPLGAKSVIRVAMSGNLQKATFTFTLVGLTKGRVQTYEAKLEDLDEESAEELTWHTLAVLGARPPPLTGSIDLLMANNIGGLEGAEYFLDDNKVPKSALNSVSPGRHRLEVHQRGFETFIWIGEVKRGRNEQVRVELKPKAAVAYDPPPPAGDGSPVETPEVNVPPPSIDPPPPPSPAITITTTPEQAPIIYTFVVGGAAVAAAGVGVAFVVMGQSAKSALQTLRDAGTPNYQACTGAKDGDGNEPAERIERSDPRCDPFRKDLDKLDRSTIGNLAGFITAGVLAAGAVGIFFLERSAGEEVSTDVAFGVAPMPGGGAVSMTLDF
jgi:hypothetical protein